MLFPVASVLGSGAALSGSELGVMGGILAGTVACGASMSWYCERFVGELSWQPAARALRVSTLNVWGNRKDRDIPVAQLASLLAPSFVPSEEVALAPAPAPALALAVAVAPAPAPARALALAMP